MGASWTYWSQDAAPCLPVAAILYWLADFLAGNERRTLQADPQAAALAAQWLQPKQRENTFVLPQRTAEPMRPAVPARPAAQYPRSAASMPTCARSKSW